MLLNDAYVTTYIYTGVYMGSFHRTHLLAATYVLDHHRRRTKWCSGIVYAAITSVSLKHREK